MKQQSTAEVTMPTITVFNLGQAKNVSPRLHHENMLSVNGHLDRKALLRPGWKNVTRLFFSDILRPTPKREIPVFGASRGPVTGHWLRHVRAFDQYDAQVAKNFMDSVAKKDENCAVHCAAGLSRSVALASFLCDHYGYDMRIVSGSWGNECANLLVYTEMFKLWMRENPDLRDKNEYKSWPEDSVGQFLLPRPRYQDDRQCRSEGFTWGTTFAIGGIGQAQFQDFFRQGFCSSSRVPTGRGSNSSEPNRSWLQDRIRMGRKILTGRS